MKRMTRSLVDACGACELCVACNARGDLHDGHRILPWALHNLQVARVVVEVRLRCATGMGRAVRHNHRHEGCSHREVVLLVRDNHLPLEVLLVEGNHLVVVDILADSEDMPDNHWLAREACDRQAEDSHYSVDNHLELEVLTAEVVHQDSRLVEGNHPPGVLVVGIRLREVPVGDNHHLRQGTGRTFLLSKVMIKHLFVRKIYEFIAIAQK
jgi:hypothetical protein